MNVDDGYTDGRMPVEVTPQSRWLDTGGPKVSDAGWRRVFDVEAVDGDDVRGTGHWEVRDRTEGDDRAEVEAPWGRVADGMVKPGQFSVSEFGGRFKPL
jgi:hypothetical protein